MKTQQQYHCAVELDWIRRTFMPDSIALLALALFDFSAFNERKFYLAFQAGLTSESLPPIRLFRRRISKYL